MSHIQITEITWHEGKLICKGCVGNDVDFLIERPRIAKEQFQELAQKLEKIADNYVPHGNSNSSSAASDDAYLAPKFVRDDVAIARAEGQKGAILEKREEPSRPPLVRETFAWGDFECVAEPPKRSLDDLILSDAALAELELALAQITLADIIYEQFNMKRVDPRKGRSVLNFYGAPGTGKTFAAHAIADRLNKRIIEVDYAEIESRWFGETEHNLRSYFRAANQADAVLFFDEADTMLGARIAQSSGADHHINRVKSLMLVQLEQFDGVVIFATNSPATYDRAFTRRISAHIAFELPDIEARERLWQSLLPKELPRTPAVSNAWLAMESSGLSGGDMLNAALMMATAAAMKSKKKRMVSVQDAESALMSVRRAAERVGVRSRNPYG